MTEQLEISVKESNPKDAVGITKVPLSTVSVPVMAEVGLGMLEGALKYGRHNYREIGVRASVYYDAVFRHIGAWWEGEDNDPESGISHLSKAMSALMVLRDAMIRNKMVDNRPRGTKDFIKLLNEKTKELLTKYPNPVPAYLGNGLSDTYQP